MDQDRLERRLSQVRLSSPGVTFEQVAERVAVSARRRRGRALLRLAIAAATVWAIAWLVQVGTDHRLQAGAAVPSAALTAGEAPVAPGALMERDQLLQELAAGDWCMDEPVQASGDRWGDTQWRSGRETVGRLGHV